MANRRPPRLSDRLYIAVFFLFLQALDVLTTYVGLRRGAREANLLPGWVLEHHGELAMYGFKVLLVLGVMLLVVRLQRIYPSVWTAIRVVNVFMLVVIAVNLFVLM